MYYETIIYEPATLFPSLLRGDPIPSHRLVAVTSGSQTEGRLWFLPNPFRDWTETEIHEQLESLLSGVQSDPGPPWS